MKCVTRFVTPFALGLAAVLAACQREQTATTQPQFTSVTDEMLLAAGSDASNAVNWVMYGGAYNNQRYSPLNQIAKANVKNLALAWTYKTGVMKSFETTPLVVDGIMYMTTDVRARLAPADDLYHEESPLRQRDAAAHHDRELIHMIPDHI